MKNLLYHLNAVKTGTQKAVVGAGAGSGNFLKVGAGAGAETNSFGFTTVRYTFLATTVFPPLRNTGGEVLELKQLFRKGL